MEEGEMKGREEMKLRREESVCVIFVRLSNAPLERRDSADYMEAVFALQHCGIGSAKRGFPACAVVS